MANTNKDDWFSRYNPFMLQNEKNEIMKFESFKDVYLQTLEYIKADCPRGYFDLSVFYFEHCGMNELECKQFFEYASKRFSYIRLNKIIHIDMGNLRAEVSKLQIILQALHLLTHTTFLFCALDWALDEYINNLQKERL